MNTWLAVAFVFASVAAVLLLDGLAVLLVRAEERWKQEAEDAERQAARAERERHR